MPTSSPHDMKSGFRDTDFYILNYHLNSLDLDPIEHVRDIFANLTKFSTNTI